VVKEGNTWKGSSVNFLRLYLGKEKCEPSGLRSPGQLALSVVVGEWHGRHLTVLVIVLALQMERVLLDLSVSEGLQSS
jgi:hypothetical protein